MFDKTKKIGLYKALKFQGKTQLSPKEKTLKSNGIALKNVKSKNTTSMIDLHKANNIEKEKSIRNLTAPKYLGKSKESQAESSHKLMVEKELNRFRKEIDGKFRSSEINSTYRFPRNTEFELEQPIEIKSNCKKYINP